MAESAISGPLFCGQFVPHGRTRRRKKMASICAIFSWMILPLGDGYTTINWEFYFIPYANKTASSKLELSAAL
jgi:hypothetical protein